MLWTLRIYSFHIATEIVLVRKGKLKLYLDC